MTTADTAMPGVRIENTGVSQTNGPFTYGQVFLPGAVPKGAAPAGVLLDGVVVPLQFDVKTSWPDGSVQHAVISGILPSIGTQQTIPMALQWRAYIAGTEVAMAPVGKAMYTADPTVTLQMDDGKIYTAKSRLGEAPMEMLYGPLAQEIRTVSALVSDGVAHPHLSVRFGVRAYPTIGRTRLEIIIENTRAFTPGAQNFKYDATVTVGGESRLVAMGLVHYHHARWRDVSWFGNPTGAAELVVHPDAAYLVSTRAIPNYDLTVKPSEKAIADWVTKNANAQGPMKIGPVNPSMPATGGRPDIAPLPGWAVCYLLSHDMRMRRVMLSAAEGSGTWPIHYRDEKTDLPVRLDQHPAFSTHMNIGGPPLPTPRTVLGMSAVPLQPDTSHQPGFTYLPYLITGDYYYLEEMHFWTAWNPTNTDPSNHGRGLGLVRFQQIRGQAWSLRTLGQAAYITPDDHPLKGWLKKQVENNIDFYHQTYVVGNPNKLGAYDGSGKGSFPLGGAPTAPGTLIAPFQDDYFTWAIGNLVNLGFESARALLNWKGQFIVKRLTSPDFPWTNGADFSYRARTLATDPMPETMGELFKHAYGKGLAKDNPRELMVHPEGKLYTDQPLDPKSQADWITQASGRTWPVGRMLGFGDYEMGYPANMQPALATLVDLKVPGADKAWLQYEQRANKQDYSRGPQFAIVPRAPVVIAPPVVVDPPPTPVDPTPVDPTPVDPTPVDPTPVDPTPVDPAPVEPPPVVTPPAPKLNARARLEIAIQAHSEVDDTARSAAAESAIVVLGEVLASERGIVQAGKK